MKKIVSLLTVLALSLSPLFGQDVEEPSIAQAAASLPNEFSTLTLALVKTDLTQTLNNDGDFTVFAPVNSAFDTLAQAVFEDATATGTDLVLFLDRETLADILLYHVVPGNLLAGDVLAADTLTTANGDDITIDATNVAIIDGQGGVSPISVTDQTFVNGTIHFIEQVLLPPTTVDPVSIYETAAGNPAFSTLVAAIEKAGLKHLLSYEGYNFTVFAPVNAAFDAAAKAALDDENATGEDLVDALSSWKIRRILFNHVAWGELFADDVLDRRVIYTFAWGRLYVDDEALTLTSRNGEANLVPELLNIEATNGVIHVIDGVLLP